MSGQDDPKMEACTSSYGRETTYGEMEHCTYLGRVTCADKVPGGGTAYILGIVYKKKKHVPAETEPQK